ncbi:MAG: peptidoglycan DD-metalloendopeptidase family protein [Deltaproteobacteria bacterium]|nr:peptidoglycan DD-metalloendopeptidase family protein [Deltaproteobacteria bacterium]
MRRTSEPMGFLYWEELRDGKSTNGSGGLTSADAVSPDAPRIIEKALKFKKGDTFFRKTTMLGLPRDAVIGIIASVRKAMDLKSIAVGDSLTLRRREGASDWFDLVFEKEDEYRLVITSGSDGYLVVKQPVILMPKLRVVEGTIENSLYTGARKAGLSYGLFHQLVDIFGWDVDFLTDLRRGDSFKVVYESWYRDGKLVKDGVILAARFTNNGRVLDAFWFQEEGDRDDYFDSEGRNLRRAFLKSPLQYRRISSTFSYKRFHPILKIYRPHLGVDYAAPSGTPVQTIGDGKVVFCGWKNGFGRLVEIRHNHGITSSYGHLRGFEKSVKTGRRVTQGQLIGWVGQSGLATGPHLHFAMVDGGKHLNPLQALRQSPPLKSLSSYHRKAFEERVAKYGPMLEGGNQLAAAE